ncbi:alpha-glucosidase [Ruminococcaceae bacterium OttesenSCG-928-I18]|nr:alpha-glucosidase [Ruminococcaceae bacterium OttesenSCG-928-I18]
MPLNRNSKIKDVWRHPLGHDVLLHLLRQRGRGEKWIENPVVANLPLTVLDRYAWPGFTDLLLEMCSTEACKPSQPELENQTWWKEAVIYQVFVPSFMDSDHDGVGDLGGVRQRLPYLERLGVNALWLRPFVREKADGSVLDFNSINENVGCCEDFEALAKAAHAQGMRLIVSIDIAATSDEHPWFTSAVQGGEHREFFFFRTGRADLPPTPERPGVKIWKYYPEIGAWGLHSGGRRRMDLNWDNPEVRSELSSVLRFWLEKGVDGFCFGATGQSSRFAHDDVEALAGGYTGGSPSDRFGFGPCLHRYFKELRDNALSGEVLSMGEVRGLGAETAKVLTGDNRCGLNMVLDASHLAAKARGRGDEFGLDLQDLRRYYLYWMENYGNEKWMSLFFENADTPRLLGRLGTNPLYRSILAKMLGTWLLTMRGTPILYQGEELGLSNTRFSSVEELSDLHSLRQCAELCERQGLSEQAALQKVLPTAADHARTPIPWSAGPGAGFTGAIPWMRLPDGAEHLNVAQQNEDPCSVLQHYRQLIQIRKQNSCLVYGSFTPVFIKNKKVLCYFRILGNHKWYVEINLTEKQISRPGHISRTQRLFLSNYDSPSRHLRPYEANLYLCENG